jgi:hypothetical protein
MAQYRSLSPREFVQEVEQFAWTRPVWRIDMHDTPEVAHANYAGLASIELLARLDTTTRGLRSIAQHVTVAPDGSIWSGRDWNSVPASVGLSMSRSAFMLKALGHFDNGVDRLEGAQLHSVITVIESVQARFSLPVQALLFPREVPQRERSAPGPSVDAKAELLRGVRSRRQGGQDKAERSGAHCH